MKWPHPVEAEMHITSELNRSGIDYKSSGSNNLKLNCPFPHSEKGADTGLHLEITKDGRKAHCWVCDWSGSWNKLAKALGLTEFNSHVAADTYTARVLDSNVFEKMQSEFNSLLSESESDEETLPTGIMPWPQPEWRGLDRKFLRSVPSYLWKQEVETKYGKKFTVDRILWPYLQYGRLMGYVGRRLDKSDFQKYFRLEGCSAKKILFPFDYVREHYPHSSSIVLVEGEVDALNLLKGGIPALSILGSNNWSDYKVDLLLASGFKRVYILMDPDPAGRAAERKIHKTLDSKFDFTKILHIEGDDDPGSLDKDQLSWLRKRVSHEKS